MNDEGKAEARAPLSPGHKAAVEFTYAAVETLHATLYHKVTGGTPSTTPFTETLEWIQGLTDTQVEGLFLKAETKIALIISSFEAATGRKPRGCA